MVMHVAVLTMFTTVGQIDSPAAERIVRFTTNDADDRHPAWRPGRHEIAFESNRNGTWDLFLWTREGTQPLLTDDTSDDRYPAWDPGGGRIVFQSDRTGVTALHVLEVGSGAVSLLVAVPGTEMFPAWSPDGEHIAFTLQPDSSMDLYLVDRAGSDLQRLTTHPARDTWSRWSPSGDEIVFFSRRNTKNREDDVYIMTLSTRQIRRVTRTSGHDFSPTWSPDGRLLAVAHAAPDGTRSIHVLTRDGAIRHVLGDGFLRMTEPDWSQNGTQLAFAGRRDDRYDIYVAILPDQLLRPVLDP